MLAGVPGALDDLAREQVQVPAHDVGELAVAEPRVDELAQQLLHGDRALDFRERSELAHEHFEPIQRTADELEPVHDVHADAELLEVFHDAAHHDPAGLDERLALGDSLARRCAAERVAHHAVDVSRQLEERRVDEPRLGAARADHVGEPERGNARREDERAVREVLAQRRPRIEPGVALRSSAVSAAMSSGGVAASDASSERFENVRPMNCTRSRSSRGSGKNLREKRSIVSERKPRSVGNPRRPKSPPPTLSASARSRVCATRSVNAGATLSARKSSRRRSTWGLSPRAAPSIAGAARFESKNPDEGFDGREALGEWGSRLASAEQGVETLHRAVLRRIRADGVPERLGVRKHVDGIGLSGRFWRQGTPAAEAA